MDGQIVSLTRSTLFWNRNATLCLSITFHGTQESSAKGSAGPRQVSVCRALSLEPGTVRTNEGHYLNDLDWMT